MREINAIREKINIFLFNSKAQTLKIFRILSLFVSLGAFGIIIYYFGFTLNEENERTLYQLIEISFAFYVTHFWVRLIYDFHPRDMIRRNWLEAIMILLLMAEGVCENLFGFLIMEKIAGLIGTPGLTNLSMIFAQVYLLITVFVDISRKTSFAMGQKLIRIHPSYLFISTFLFIILVGAALLMLPEMTTDKQGMNFIDAVFTSTSATCVTGLIIYDTAAYFTFKGHFVIMMLIKLGGLNIIAFGTFMALFSRLGLGVKQHEVIEDFVNKDSLLSSKGMFGKIVLISVVLELLGSLAIFMMWNPNIEFDSTGDRIFHSVFHSISSFNNAGFSTFTDGFYNHYIRYSYLIHLISAVLIFLGSIGFTTLLEIFEIKQMRERLRFPWKQLSTSSKISLYTTIGLMVGGMIIYYILEKDNAFAGKNFLEGWITALYTSVTRTAGFNTIDFSQLTMPAIILTLFLMFVGASSSSTGGGIKTSSFFLIVSSTYATITGRRNIEFNKRTIPNELVNKAYSVLVYTLFMVLISTFALTITEGHLLTSGEATIMDIIFEEISAFSTVGLSIGLTPLLSDAGKWIIVVSMFIGRIGTLTVAYALTRNLSNLKYKYPDAHLMVG